MIDQHDVIWNEHYLNRLRGKIFKIIPLMESENEGLYSYVCSLTFQISGLKHVIKDIENSNFYIDMWAVLEEVMSELVAPNPDKVIIRSEVLRIVNTIGKLQKGEIK